MSQAGFDGDLQTRDTLEEGTPEPCQGQRKCPDQLLDRGARMVFDSGRPVAHVANDVGIHQEALRKWVRKTEADEGKRRICSARRSARS
jgi:transposase-like protein